MRLLLLNQYFYPDQSATAQLLTELSEDLAAHHDVTVVTGRPSYNPTAHVRSRGLISFEHHGRVRVLRAWSTSFDRSSTPGRLTNYGSFLCASLAGVLRADRPDAVMAFTDPPLVGTIGALAGRRWKVPLVVVVKDLFPDVAVVLGRLRNPLAVRALRAQTRHLLSAAERVVSIGSDMSERLGSLGVGVDKLALIHDWADGSRIRPLTGPSALRREHGWGDRFVVMHSGNVGLSQDLDTMLAAAELLRAQEDVLFVVIGEGAARAGLVREAGRRGLDNVQFLPYQPKDRLSESLGAADLHVVGLHRGLRGFIVPSKVYGIMAAGRPFIAAAEEGSEPARIVAEHRCGVRVEPGDPGALAKAILWARESDLAAMGDRARQAFEQRFDRPLASAAYLRLLEELAPGA